MNEWREVDEPRIWVSRFMSDIELVSFDWLCDGKKIDYVNAANFNWCIASSESAPKGLFLIDTRRFRKSELMPS